jgi:hypothetical protein
VVDVDLDVSNQLDPGRKGISDHYAGLISTEARTLINTSTVDGSDRFSAYASRHLDHGHGPGPGGLPPTDFQIKVNQVREQEEQQQSEDEDLVSMVRAVSHLDHLPIDEQEVIALFYECLAQNIIKGYRTVYLAGSTAVYDAAFEYEIEATPENSFPNDPVGIGQLLIESLQDVGRTTYVHRDHYGTRTALPELCVEFKKSVGGLLEELQHPRGSSKDPSTIDLAIVWDTHVPAALSTEHYTLDSVVGNRRTFHGTTHRIGLVGDRITEILCIALREVLVAKRDADTS